MTSETDIDGRIGQGWGGISPNGAHVNIVLARRGSPTAAALMTTFTAPSPGHTPVLVCVGADQPSYEAVVPPTIMMNKATTTTERHQTMTFGAAQLGIGQGVLDAVADGVLAADQDTVVFVAIWIDEAAARRDGAAGGGARRDPRRRAGRGRRSDARGGRPAGGRARRAAQSVLRRRVARSHLARGSLFWQQNGPHGNVGRHGTGEPANASVGDPWPIRQPLRARRRAARRRAQRPAGALAGGPRGAQRDGAHRLRRAPCARGPRPRAAAAQEHAPPDLRDPRRARLGAPRRGGPLRAGGPRDRDRQPRRRVADRHRLPPCRRRPHDAPRRDRLPRGRGRRRVGLRRDRGDDAAGAPADLGRPSRARVRVRQRTGAPRRPLAPRRSPPSSAAARS